MTPSDSKRRHATVVVEVGAWREEVDEAIAPLIAEVWKAGIPTLMSCQETDPRVAWIEFEEVAHLQQFLNLVAVYEDGAGTMYNRIAHELVAPAPATASWEYQLNPLDCGEDRGARPHAACACDFVFTAGVYIPHADLTAVLDRLRRHRRRPISPPENASE